MPELSSAEIGVMIDEKQKELAEAIRVNDTITNSDIEISKEILTRQLKRKELQQSLIKSKSNMRLIALELKSLTNKFWQAKHAGL